MTRELEEIRRRREVSVEHALALLDLCPSASGGEKQLYLSAAARCLGDPAVAARWIELAGAEADPRLRRQMLARTLELDFRQVPHRGAFLRLLLSSLRDPETRRDALHGLERCMPGDELVVEGLIDAYRQGGEPEVQRRIVALLCRCPKPSAVLVNFFLEIAEHAGTSAKLAIVGVLLRVDAAPVSTLARWLAPSEPSAVKLAVLWHLIDRWLSLEQPLCAVLRQDPDSECRVVAARALAAQLRQSPEAVSALLDALRLDPDTRVRQESLLALVDSGEPTDEVVAVLLQALREERSREAALTLIRVLAPSVSRSQAARQGFLELLGANLHAEVAQALWAALGELSSWDAQLPEVLLDAYLAAGDDRIRAALLRALSRCAFDHPRMAAVFADAVRAPNAEIRTWGARGLLMVPLVEAHWSTVAEGVPALLDEAMDSELRRALARKIARIPQPPRTTLEGLRRVADQCDDEVVRTTCQEALDHALSRVSGPAGGGAVDLDRWRYRVSVEHSVSGLFPEIYRRFEENPAAMLEILRTALLDPACRASLHECRVHPTEILEFLLAKGAVDDDVCRYCVESTVTWSGMCPDLFLAALKSNPSYEGLEAGLWRILEASPASGSFSELNLDLLRELLVEACGGDAATGEKLRFRLLATDTPEAAAPLLKLLCGDPRWPPAGQILLDAFARPALMDETSREMVAGCLRLLELERRAPGGVDVQAGLADD